MRPMDLFERTSLSLSEFEAARRPARERSSTELGFLSVGRGVAGAASPHTTPPVGPRFSNIQRPKLPPSHELSKSPLCSQDSHQLQKPSSGRDACHARERAVSSSLWWRQLEGSGGCLRGGRWEGLWGGQFAPMGGERSNKVLEREREGRRVLLLSF